VKPLLGDLATNLRHGLRAVLFRPVSLYDFRIGAEQVVALFLLMVAGRLAMDLAMNGPGGSFNVQALTNEVTIVGALLLSGFIISRLTGEPRLLPGFPVVLLAMDPWFLLVQTALRWTATSGWLALPRIGWGLHVGLIAWFLLAAFFALRRFAPGRPTRACAGFAAYLAFFFGAYWALPAQDMWKRADLPREAAKTSVTDEAVFHAQPLLLEASLAALRPGRPGITDVYFVGFGAYSHEDVFMKEVKAIDELFRSRFDAEGRSVILINNAQTAAEVPVASATNLARVLRHVGGLMNRDEDVLVLYVTTHGSEKHRLSVVNWPLALQEIDPAALARMLAESGIKWRVLAISACYSGGFVDALKSDTTLVMTAAAADRQSFGCGNDSDFTYFGRALFDEALRNTFSFEQAFQRARQAIAERERAQKFVPSNPQIYAGAAIGGKLRELEARLQWLATLPVATEEDR
jgi:hypothetical protein